MYKGFLYFIYSPTSDKVKIGVTKNNPYKRLETLQTGSPDILSLPLYLGINNNIIEGLLHKELSHHGSHREWFHCNNIFLDLAKLLWKYQKYTYSNHGYECNFTENLASAFVFLSDSNKKLWKRLNNKQSSKEIR